MQHANPRETCPTPMDAMIQRAGLTDARATTSLRDAALGDALRAMNNAIYAAAKAAVGDAPLAAELRAMAHRSDEMVDACAEVAA